MIVQLEARLQAIQELCPRYRVRRLEVFGSAQESETRFVAQHRFLAGRGMAVGAALLIATGCGGLLVPASAAEEAAELADPAGRALPFMMLPLEERQARLRELAGLGDPRAADFFAEVTASADEDLAEDEKIFDEVVLPFLSVFARPEHLETARKASRSGNPLLERYAARWLGYTGAGEAAQDLARLAQSENAFVRRAALAGLLSLGAPGAADILEVRAKDARDAEEKEEAARFAKRLRSNLGRPKHPPSPYPPDFSTVTAHVPWAKPLAKKPRVLFLMERAVLRDFIEVCQRMDVEGDTVDIPCQVEGKAPGDLERLEIREDVRHVVLDRLEQRWDAIVVVSILAPARLPDGHTAKGEGRGWTGWRSFPEEVQRGLLKASAAGAGLVLMDGGPETIAGTALTTPEGNGFHAWPAGARLESFGRGRIARFTRGIEARTWGSVLLDLRDRLPMGPGFLVPALPGRTRQVYPSEDFFYAAFCRCILWSCGRDLEPGWAGVSFDAQAGKPGALALRFTAPPPTASRVRAEVADAYIHVLAAAEAEAASESLSLPLPPFPAGACVVRLKLLDARGNTLNWAAFLAEIHGAARIEAAITETRPAPPDQPLTAQARLSGEMPAGAALVAKAVDPWGRVVGRARKTLDAGQTLVPVQLDNGRLLSRVVTMSLTLEGPGGEPLASLDQPVVVAHAGDFLDVPWLNFGGDAYLDLWKRVRPDHVSFLALETLEAGLDVAGSWSDSCPNHDPGPYAADGVRRPCLTSPKWEMQLEQEVGDKARAYSALDGKLYLLSDETSLGGDYCFSPSCLDAFRDHLQAEYGSLEALNASWNTRYSRWEEVLPLRKEEMRDSDHPGPWLDHALFQDQVYTGMYGRIQTLYRSWIPGARAGSSTTDCRDAWLFARRQGLAALFVSIRYRHEEMSFRPEGQLLGGWFQPGYGYRYLEDEAGVHYWGWDQVLHGATALFTWVGAFGFSYPMVRGDLSPDRILLATRDLAEDIRSGYGRLLLGAKRRAGDYAVYYSPRSNLVAEAIAKASRPGEVKSARSFAPAYDADMVFRFPRIVAYAEIEMGYLRTHPPEVLYLPLVRCLSPTEIAEIQRYVEGGGVLLAAADAGLRDVHGVPQDPWPLERLFGLKRRPAPAQAAIPWAATPVHVEGIIEGIDLTGVSWVFDPGEKPTGSPPVLLGGDVQPTGAKALFRIAGVPAGWVHPYGRGLAVYFDFDPSLLKRADQKEDEASGHQALLELIFRGRGLRRGYEVEWKVGRPMVAGRPGFALAEFRDGNARYLAFLHAGQGALREQPKESVALTLDDPAHAYLARSGTSLGLDRAFRFEFPRGEAFIASLMPYAVRAVEVQASAATPGSGAKVRARVLTDGPPPGRHVLALRVYRPDGLETPWFRKNLEATGGSAEHLLPLEWNAPPGSWKVRVRDVATGLSAEAEMAVGKP
ncbi:MAG: beta-galactosidase [Planctomycetes bacterium]|nr:beta-galactosidase [Planctomycetota bacterium]